MIKIDLNTNNMVKSVKILSKEK